jgi:hypothetical protein
VSKLVWLNLLAPLALMGACSQSDTRPPPLPDCTECTTSVVIGGGGVDSGGPDIGIFDVTTPDVTNDADATDDSD